jgi:hypothetical protein
VPDGWGDAAPAQPEVGEYYLPGVGATYLDPGFADKVGDFIQRAKDQGVSLQFDSGYRNQAKQDALQKDPTAITPAQHSLHSAGRGVDVANWSSMDEPTHAAVLESAKGAGLSWGGNFSKPDPVHFYSDPGTDRRELIDNFSRAVAAFREQIPDR